jgi:hypothetical protein
MLAILKKAAPAIADAPVSPPRAALPISAGGSSSFRTWHVNGRSVRIDRDNFLRERSERMRNASVVKRAPDEPVVTINATDTALYPT